MKNKILDAFNARKIEDRSIEGIKDYFHISSIDDFKLLMKSLNELEEDGLLVTSKKDNYFLPKELNMEVGIFSLNKNGYGFVSVEELERDIYIPKGNSKGAFDNDLVLVETKPSNTGQHDEGKVIKIIKRNKTRFVGTLKKLKRDYCVQVDDPKFNKLIIVDSAHLHGAMINHIVLVEIKVYKPIIKGDIIKVLGHKNDPGVDILSIVEAHEAPVEFSDKIYEQLDEIGYEIDYKDLDNRVDLRNETIITIDGDDSKDLDDAISLKKLDNGNYYLGVHIADVSYYVQKGSYIDEEALLRGTSIYLADRVIPMLPHKLSNGICSLNEGVDRYAITCFMEIDSKGNVVNHSINPTIINSNHRMTYSNVNKILDDDKELINKYKDVYDLFLLMHELKHILNEKELKKDH